MCGNHKISSTKLDFVTSLGGTHMFEHENMHAKLTAPKEDLLFCYPADKRSKPGVISSMYLAYRQLAYVLKDTIYQKAGDYSAIPDHMVNIMRLAHPDALRRVDGIDIIWEEIHNGVIERRSPAYAPYLHRFFMSTPRKHWSDIMSGRRLVTHELHTPTVVLGHVPPEYTASIQPSSHSSSASRTFKHGDVSQDQLGNHKRKVG
jgi:hypothetical protein